MAITLQGQHRVFGYPLHSGTNSYPYSAEARPRLSCIYPDTFWTGIEIDKIVQAHVDHSIEAECIAYLAWLWHDAEGDRGTYGVIFPAMQERWKKLKLYKIPREKISWRNLWWGVGLRAVEFEPRYSPSPDESDDEKLENARKHEQKMARITVDDVLREIEKHLMKSIKKDFVKVTEKDLCEMAHAHEHAAVKDKNPGMQRVLTGAATTAHHNYASACGGKWGYVSARWQQSRAPGDVLRLQFERYDGKTVELTAEEMHFHWRSNEERVRSHPVLMLANAWLDRHFFA